MISCLNYDNDNNELNFCIIVAHQLEMCMHSCATKTKYSMNKNTIFPSTTPAAHMNISSGLLSQPHKESTVYINTDCFSRVSLSLSFHGSRSSKLNL